MKKKKFLRRFSLFSLIFAVLPLILSVCVSAAKKSDKSKDQPSGFVHADGKDIIGIDGEKLVIKGIAFGNSVWSNKINYNHHTEDSYKELSEMGFNSVRFYINYCFFEDDAAPYKYKESGFKWLDKNVKWAKKYGMGIIINMHCPQGGYQSSGNGMELWNDAENQNRLIALWKAIAERYSGEPAVWGYGLLNEPYVPLLDTMEKSAEQYFELTDRIAKEVRKASPHQALFVECLCNAKDINGEKVPDYDWFVPENTFPKINDQNVIYEFHCYSPFSFTHQGTQWAGTEGITMTYPSEQIVSAEYENGWVGCLTADSVNTDGEWTYFESRKLQLSNNYNIASAALYAHESDGAAYFDDITVTEISPNGKKKTLYFYDFNEGNVMGLYPWSPDGTGVLAVSDNGRNGSGCLKISGNRTALTASADKFILKNGYYYVVSGYAKSDTADSKPAVRLDYAKASSCIMLNKDYLESEIKIYADYSEKHNVPIYMGEFGVISEGFKKGRNGAGWVSDIIDICEQYRISYNYHTYHETSFGLYANNDAELPSELNKELEKVLRDKLKRAK